jgi:hypothetical protein
VRTPEDQQAKLKMLKNWQRPPKHPQSDLKRTLMNKECTKKSCEILGVKDENTQLRVFLQVAGLPKKQLYDESKVEVAQPTRKRWMEGQPMLEDFKFNNATQTQKFHKWCRDQAKAGREMFGFQYKHNHFLHGDRDQ